MCIYIYIYVYASFFYIYIYIYINNTPLDFRKVCRLRRVANFSRHRKGRERQFVRVNVHSNNYSIERGVSAFPKLYLSNDQKDGPRKAACAFVLCCGQPARPKPHNFHTFELPGSSGHQVQLEVYGSTNMSKRSGNPACLCCQCVCKFLIKLTRTCARCVYMCVLASFVCARVHWYV
jgi:hypothetical protein